MQQPLHKLKTEHARLKAEQRSKPSPENLQMIARLEAVIAEIEGEKPEQKPEPQS